MEFITIGIICAIIVLIVGLMKKKKAGTVIAVEIIVLCLTVLVSVSLSSLTVSNNGNPDSNLNKYFSALSPFANLKKMALSSGPLAKQENPRSAELFEEYLWRLIGFHIFDFGCSCLITASLYYIFRKKHISLLLGTLIPLIILSAKIIFYRHLMLDSLHFFDTAELIACIVGSICGLICSIMIVNHRNGEKQI